MTMWRTYRLRGWTLDRLIEGALVEYNERFGVPPQRMFVPPCQVEQAANLVPEGVEVKGNGGALTGEVWLAEPDATMPEARAAWAQGSLL